MLTNSVIQSAVGRSDILAVNMGSILKPKTDEPKGWLPSVHAWVSAGAVLTYNIEVTADDVSATGYNSANGHWIPIDTMTGLTASKLEAIAGAVTAVSINVTARTSGYVNLSFAVPQ